MFLFVHVICRKCIDCFTTAYHARSNVLNTGTLYLKGKYILNINAYMNISFCKMTSWLLLQNILLKNIMNITATNLLQKQYLRCF